MNVYTLKEIECLLGTDLNQGLSQTEAMQRIHRDGFNEIQQAAKKPIFLLF